MDEIDPSRIAQELMENGNTATSGTKKFCIRGKQCVRAITCEHAHADKRGVSVSVEDLFSGRAENLGDCANWAPRQELCSEGDVPRRRPGSGSRHNSHAPDRTAARESLGFYNVPDLTKGSGQLKDAFSPQNGGRLLTGGGGSRQVTPPDPMTKRHIRNGQNIKEED